MRIEYETELYHHGVKGMKWFRRRYQNEDGSYTSLGRIHYGIGTARREAGTTAGALKNLATVYGNDARQRMQNAGQRARQGASNFQANARKGLATAGVIAGLGVGAAGRDVYNTVNTAARAGNRAVNSAADRATNALNVASGLAGKYGRQAIAGAKGAAAAGLVAKNGLQLRAQDLAGRAGNAARSTSNEMREILKAYGKDIKGNAGNYINRARSAADLARTAVGVAGLDAREAAGRLGNRARDAAGYARTAAGVAGLDAMDRIRNAAGYAKTAAGVAGLDAMDTAGRLGNRVKAGATQGAVNAILAGRQAARLARGAKRMYNDSDLALQVQGAKNLAGNYARIAKDSVGAAGRSARNALAGISGEDVLRGAQGAFGRTALGVYNGANRAGREAKTTAGALRNLAGVYGNDAMDRARNMRDNAVQRYVQYAYQKSADDPYKYKRVESPVDARRNEIANRMLNKGPQTSMTGRTVNDYQREMIERAQRSAKTANYQSEMASRAQAAQPRREQSGYMDRIQALQNANRYRADIAAAGGTRQSIIPALALGQAARTSAGIASSRAGNLSAGASAAARRGFVGYKNEHPNSEMSFDEYKRKYGWMYGGV